MALQNTSSQVFILDGRGGLLSQTLSSESIDASFKWIHINRGNLGEKQFLLIESGLREQTVDTLLEPFVRPRAIISPEGMLLSLRILAPGSSDDPIDIISIRMYATDQCVVTVSDYPVPALDVLRASLHQGLGPQTPQGFAYAVNELALTQVAEMVERIDSRLDGLEEAVFGQENCSEKSLFSQLMRECVLIRSYLLPHKEVLMALVSDLKMDSNVSKKAPWRKSLNGVSRLLDDLTLGKERLLIVQQHMAASSSDQLNYRMYVLSLLAAIFLPLTFITGLLGVNVGGIPGATYKWGFSLVCVLTGVIFLGSVWWFHRKKWF